MTWAAQAHQTGHMRPAGRVFETPAVNYVLTRLVERSLESIEFEFVVYV